MLDKEQLIMLHNFFFGQICDKEALKTLMYLYDVNREVDLFSKFKKEIEELKKRFLSELANTKTDSFVEDLTLQIEGLDLALKVKDVTSVIKTLRNKFDDNSKYYKEYTEKLSAKLKNTKNQIKYIIIYEAPPFAGQYILKSEKFTDGTISTYWHPIRDILVKSDPNKSPSQNMIDNCIGFIDLSLVPLPLKEIRGDWSTQDKYNLHGKQLPVWLFEWALTDFIKKINYQIVPKPFIAIGIPNKTSISIFDYYSDRHYKDDYVSIDVSEPNTKNEKELYRDYPEIFTALKSRTLRLNKTNVTSGSGFPNGLLMKLALGINLGAKK